MTSRTADMAGLDDPTAAAHRPRLPGASVVISKAKVTFNYSYDWCLSAGEHEPMTMGWSCPICTAEWFNYMVDAAQQEEAERRGVRIPLELAVHVGSQRIPLDDAMGGILDSDGKCIKCKVQWVPE